MSELINCESKVSDLPTSSPTIHKIHVKLVPIVKGEVNAIGTSISKKTLNVCRSSNGFIRIILLGKLKNHVKNIRCYSLDDITESELHSLFKSESEGVSSSSELSPETTAGESSDNSPDSSPNNSPDNSPDSINTSPEIVPLWRKNMKIYPSPKSANSKVACKYFCHYCSSCVSFKSNLVRHIYTKHKSEYMGRRKRKHKLGSKSKSTKKIIKLKKDKKESKGKQRNVKKCGRTKSASKDEKVSKRVVSPVKVGNKGRRKSSTVKEAVEPTECNQKRKIVRKSEGSPSKRQKKQDDSTKQDQTNLTTSKKTNNTSRTKTSTKQDKTNSTTSKKTDTSKTKTNIKRARTNVTSKKTNDGSKIKTPRKRTKSQSSEQNDIVNDGKRKNDESKTKTSIKQDQTNSTTSKKNDSSKTKTPRQTTKSQPSEPNDIVNEEKRKNVRTYPSAKQRIKENWRVESIISNLCKSITQNESNTESTDCTQLGSNDCKLDCKLEFRKSELNINDRLSKYQSGSSKSSEYNLDLSTNERNESTLNNGLKVQCIHCWDSIYFDEDGLR